MYIATKTTNMKRSIFIVLVALSLGFQSSAQNPTIEQILSEVNIDSMIHYASAISGEFPVNLADTTVTIASRHKSQPGNGFAADYIEQKLASFGFTPDVQSWSTTGENIVATQPGLEYPNQKYVICAHYDAMPTAIAPAADDDGSGTATLIELARVLSQYEFVFTIEYGFWDEEEQGLVGSREYAEAAALAGDSILGVINMDALAWDGNGDGLMRIHTRPTANSEDLSEIAVSVNTAYDIGLDIAVNNPGATYSDHASFWNNGFGAILIIEDFDNDGNPHYHTTTDLVQYFDTAYYEKLSLLSAGTISSLAIPYLGPSSVEEREFKWINHYPDPADKIVTFELPEGTWTYRIADVNGRIVETGSPENGRIDVSQLTSGGYFVSFLDEKTDKQLTQRILKK
ncbi:MAG: hypothetical protein ACI85F_001649 [Bacteroidia bacterium]|jgi:hypothetical protein